MALLSYFFDLTPSDLEQLVQSWGLPRFRAGQLLKWVYRRGVAEPQQMTDLSQADRQIVAERMVFTRGRVIRHQSATDGTQKLLIDWRSIEEARGEDRPTTSGNVPTLAVLQPEKIDTSRCTECVMIPAENPRGGERRTACISSQVGCPVGCRFCASGLGGLDANLSRGQIAEQVWWLNRLPGNERITNVVFMGMGEPLANFAAVTGAIDTLMAEWSFGISGRKITVSTVGLPAQIRRLAELDLPITLAISLHAPNDDLRQTLIPWAEKTSVEALVEAGRYYFEKTGREVTIEYLLLRSVNDRIEHAKELAAVAKRLRSNVNLIRYNEVKGIPFDRPTSEDVSAFERVLQQAGVNVHIRASRGRDIAAACGQLRHEAK